MGAKLWQVVSEFKQESPPRRMLKISCPDCGYTVKIRKTEYHKPRACKRCRFRSENRSSLGSHKGVGDLTRTYFNYFKNVAKRRGESFTVSIEYLWDLAVAQDMKCALSGLPIVFPTMSDAYGHPALDENKLQRMRMGCSQWDIASLDRIDSNRAYEEGNVQWVNKYVNIMKNGLSQDEFIFLCHRIAELHADPEPSELNGHKR